MISIKRLENFFVMYDNAKPIGKCEFSQKDKTINKFYNCSDNDDLYIVVNLCKAVLNYFELHNMLDIKCLDNTYKDILISIGFADNLTIDLTNYFTKKCDSSR